MSELLSEGQWGAFQLGGKQQPDEEKWDLAAALPLPNPTNLFPRHLTAMSPPLLEYTRSAISIDDPWDNSVYYNDIID
jgi:hypothetical protein